MLVTLKTLQEDSFTVECDPCETVKRFKELIQMVKGDRFAAKDLKLMYAGKFLLDGNRLCDYHVQERKFVIVVVRKPKIEPMNVEEPEARAGPSASRHVFANGTPQSSGEEIFLRAQHEALVQRITELGFSRAEVEAALGASCNNPDRAVEYLINGSCSTGVFRDPNEERNRPSSSRRSSSPIVPNDRLYDIFTQAISECQARTRMQDYAIEQEAELITQSFEQMEAEHREALRQNPSAALPPNALNGGQVLSPAECWNEALGFTGNLLDRDHEAIARLKTLGFSTKTVIEAYFICERNEQAAAAYLLNQVVDNN